MYICFALILVVLGMFYFVGYNNPVGEYNAPEHTETLIYSGILSARWAGEHGNDKANNALLLKQLADIPDSKRTARFRCAAALVVPGERKTDGADDDKPYTIASETVEVGEMPGVLLRAPRGANGFGYDPLFVPNDQPQRAVDAGEKLTSAEMEPAEKNAVSHRGKALRALVASIEALVK